MIVKNKSADRAVSALLLEAKANGQLSQVTAETKIVEPDDRSHQAPSSILLSSADRWRSRLGLAPSILLIGSGVLEPAEEALLAEMALAARDVERHQHMVAGLKVLNRRAGLLDDAGEFVAEGMADARVGPQMQFRVTRTIASCGCSTWAWACL